MLTFNIRPDHESPDDADPSDNEYNIVVVASDGAPGSGTEADPIQMGYKKVVVKVTDEDERGVITLTSLQPQVGATLTATLADPEAPSPANMTWEWERSQDGSSGWETIPGAEVATLTPVDDDVDHYLRVTATYDVADGDDTERTSQAVSVNKARAAPATADATAVFPSDPADANARRVDENLPAGTEVGKPVAATDTLDDVLTYSLTGINAASFEIDPATGQITVGSRTVLDHETTGTYSVTVTVTEASGDEVTQVVTITVNDVNEAPMVTGGVTMQRHTEDDADVATDNAEVLTVATYTATDLDVGTTLTWSVEGADKDLFSIGESDGALVFKKAPNYEMPTDAGSNNVYNVTVVATDDGVDADGKNEMTAMRAVVITVTNVEEDGTVTLSAVQPKTGIALTASVTDLDGGVTDEEWQWSSSDAETGTYEEIDDADSATYTPVDGDVTRFLRATVTYTDNNAEDTAMGTASNAVLARGDHEPEFAATETGKRMIAEDAAAGDPVGDPVTATDRDTADILTYRLSGRDAASFTIEQRDASASPPTDGGEIRVKAGTELDHETKPTHMVTVTATDPGGLSASVDVTITVTDVNEAPEVMGDAEKEYAENGTRPVATYTARDPESGVIYWSLLEAPGSVEVDGTALTNDDTADFDDFSISADGVLTFNIRPDHESPDDEGSPGDNEYHIVVVASDGAPGSGTSEDPIQMGYKKVVVEVTEVDERGVITLPSRQPQVGVQLDATLDDPEAPSPASVTWKWERSRSRSSGFALATGTGADTDTYTPVDDDVLHYLRVTATYNVASDDDTERTAQAVSVRAARAAPGTSDETATFPTGSNARRVDENLPAGTEVGKPVAATDTADDVLTYSLTGTNAASFEIDPATGQITVGSRTVLDHEATPTYSVTVTATEVSGDEVTQVVTITVNDVNEAPMVTGGVTMQRHTEDDADVATDNAEVLTVATYTATDLDVGTTLTWSVEGADKDLFSIGESDGALVFKKAPNYEMPTDAGSNNVYNVTSVATDDGVDADGKNEMTAMRAVVITVTNVEEDGTVTLSAVQPKAGIALTASVTDLDGGVTDEEWQWSSSDAETGTYEEIDDADSATYTPVDGDMSRFLRATVTYTDNNAEDTAMGTASNPVIPRGDHEPEFAATETGKRMIAEDAAAGDPVGDPVTATDGDTADVLTYRLSGRDAASFTIEQRDASASPPTDGGEIRVKAGTELDHETKPTHMVTVTATDPGGLSASVDVTITVTDVNEAPEIMRAPDANVAPEFASATTSRTVAENTVAGTGIGDPVTATDNNGDTLTYRLGGDDMASFDIDSDTGQLMTLAALNYETKASYSVTVTASDPEGASDMITVTVTVTNVEEPGMVTLWASATDALTMAPQVEDTITGAVMDPDGGVMVESWQWARTMDTANMNSWMDIEDASVAAYMVTADDTGYYLRVMATYTDAAGTDMAMEYSMPTMMVGAEAGDTLLDRYDADKDGWIQLTEARVAVGDYFGPPRGEKLSLDDTRKVVGLYFDYKNRPQ